MKTLCIYRDAIENVICFVLFFSNVFEPETVNPKIEMRPGISKYVDYLQRRA